MLENTNYFNQLFVFSAIGKMVLYTVIPDIEGKSADVTPQFIINSVLQYLQRNVTGFDPRSVEVGRWQKMPSDDTYFCMGNNRICFVPGSEPMAAQLLEERLKGIGKDYAVRLLKE